MKKFLIFTGGLASAAGAGYYYLDTHVKEETIPESFFYYKEHQCKYKDLHKEFQVLEKIRDTVRPSYDAGKVSILGFYYDNPYWLADPNKCRTALGFRIAKDLPQADKQKITPGMTYASFPAFKAMTIPMYFCQFNFLFSLYASILMKKYAKKYDKELHEKHLIHFPAGEMYSAKGSKLFSPLPNDAKRFNYVKAPKPELNEQGKAYEASFKK